MAKGRLSETWRAAIIDVGSATFPSKSPKQLLSLLHKNCRDYNRARNPDKKRSGLGYDEFELALSRELIGTTQLDKIVDWTRRHLKLTPDGRAYEEEEVSESSSAGINPPETRLPREYRYQEEHHVPRRAREGEILRACKLDRRGGDGFLVTLVGGSGLGKTHLLIRSAEALATKFDDMVFFVDLIHAKNTDDFYTAERLSAAIGSSMGLKGASSRPRDLLKATQNLRCLILLDGYDGSKLKHHPGGEHAQDSAFDFIDKLLKSPRSTSLLVTGRSRLGVEPMEETIDLQDGLEPEEARALFEVYARKSYGKQEWEPTDRERESIRLVLEAAEGNPLAIEIAAAWVKEIGLREVARRLGDADLAGLPEHVEWQGAQHHRSLDTSFMFAFRNLEVKEKELMAKLSIFGGSFSLDAVVRTTGLGVEAVQKGLHELHRFSLLRNYEGSKTLRYKFDKFSRAFAKRMLKNTLSIGIFLEPSEISKMEREQATHYLEQAEAAAPFVKKGDQTLVDELQEDLENLNEALRWAVAYEPEYGLSVATKLWEFWWVKGVSEAGLEHLDALMAAVKPTLPIWPDAAAAAGQLARHRGEFDKAEELYEKSLKAYGEENPSGVATVLRHMSVLAWHRKKMPEARELLVRALAESERSGDEWQIAESKYQTANLDRYEGRSEDAARQLKEGLDHYRSTQDVRGTATAHLALGNVLTDQGRLADAWCEYDDALELFDKLKDLSRITLTLERVAAFCRTRGRVSEAAELLGAADALRTQTGNPLPGPDRTEYFDQLERDLRQALGADYKAGRAHGASIPLKQALELAHRQLALG